MEVPGISLEYKFKSRIKQLFCKPHVYKTITNFYGDAIIDMSMGRRETVRSMLCCTKCGKFKPSPFLDKNCKVVNFDLIHENGRIRSVKRNENYRTLDNSREF